MLVRSRVIEDALAPSLMSDYGSQEEVDAIVARASMALANRECRHIHAVSRPRVLLPCKSRSVIVQKWPDWLLPQ